MSTSRFVPAVVTFFLTLYMAVLGAIVYKRYFPKPEPEPEPPKMEELVQVYVIGLNEWPHGNASERYVLQYSVKGFIQNAFFPTKEDAGKYTEWLRASVPPLLHPLQ